jgi:hypothetical protein
MQRQSRVRRQGDPPKLVTSISTVWLVSGLGFSGNDLEVPGATQTHALFDDAGGSICTGFDSL